MIITEFYKGQGLGNQLWCYVTTRVLSLDKGYDFGIQSPENFKAQDFLNLDFGKKVTPEKIKIHYEEQKIIHPYSGCDIRMFDHNLLNIEDGTKIYGCLQDEQYITHRKAEIKKWLKVKEEFECYDYSDDNICIINFRGSSYAYEADLYLTKKYWNNAIANMLKINPNLKFIVITEDAKNARKFFPDYEIHHFSIAKDYVIVKNAKYLILSNSSFAWFPAWLSEDLKYCIAPKYWAKHNVSDGYWSLGYNITSGWMYQDRLGNLSDYHTCLEELTKYKNINPQIFSQQIFNKSYTNKIKYHINIFNTFSEETSVLKAAVLMLNFVSTEIYMFLRSNAGKIKIIGNNLIKKAKRTARKIIYSTENAQKRIKWRVEEYQAKKTWLSPEKIKEYKKTIKIYDAFNFFNELDILELRLNILNDYVDFFVIVESPLTHSGQPKELFFENNKDRYKKFAHKIIHYIIPKPLEDFKDARKRLDDPNTSEIERKILQEILSSDNILAGSNDFLRDFYEKEYIKVPLQNLNDDDFCFVSDLDEIWNPEITIDYSQDHVFKPLLDNYVYFLNNRSNEIEGGTGTIGTKYKNIKNNCLGHLRTARKTKYIRLHNGGWHFTFQGLQGSIEQKLKAYSYQSNTNLEARKKIKEKIMKNEDIFGRHFTFWKDESKLPKYILCNKEKYKRLLK